jgi:hypothetical protein
MSPLEGEVNMAKRSRTRATELAPQSPAPDPDFSEVPEPTVPGYQELPRITPASSSQEHEADVAAGLPPGKTADRGAVKAVEVTSSGTRRIEYYRPSEW